MTKWIDEQIAALKSDKPEELYADTLLKTLEALKKAEEALKQNHRWHFDHDDYDGYEESELHDINAAAIMAIEDLGKE